MRQHSTQVCGPDPPPPPLAVAPRPYSVSLACSMASSAERKVRTASTGPKTSSRHSLEPAGTSLTRVHGQVGSTVGGHAPGRGSQRNNAREDSGRHEEAAVQAGGPPAAGQQRRAWGRRRGCRGEKGRQAGRCERRWLQPLMGFASAQQQRRGRGRGRRRRRRRPEEQGRRHCAHAVRRTVTLGLLDVRHHLLVLPARHLREPNDHALRPCLREPRPRPRGARTTGPSFVSGACGSPTLMASACWCGGGVRRRAEDGLRTRERRHAPP